MIEFFGNLISIIIFSQ